MWIKHLKVRYIDYVTTRKPRRCGIQCLWSQVGFIAQGENTLRSLKNVITNGFFNTFILFCWSALSQLIVKFDEVRLAWNLGKSFMKKCIKWIYLWLKNQRIWKINYISKMGVVHDIFPRNFGWWMILIQINKLHQYWQVLHIFHMLSFIRCVCFLSINHKHIYIRPLWNEKKHIYEKGIVCFSHLTFVYGCGIGPTCMVVLVSYKGSTSHAIYDIHYIYKHLKSWLLDQN
jgi:hypothetical protein